MPSDPSEKESSVPPAEQDKGTPTNPATGTGNAEPEKKYATIEEVEKLLGEKVLKRLDGQSAILEDLRKSREPKPEKKPDDGLVERVKKLEERDHQVQEREARQKD